MRGLATTMEPSLIRLIAEQAWHQPETIRLELGEPGVPTPAHVVEAADDAARSGLTRYTPNGGIARLREALARKLSDVNRFHVAADEIVVGAGGVQVLYAALTALVRPGDEILIPDPGWPDYRMMCDLLGARAVGYPCQPPDPAELEHRITARTRVLITNNPSNPLGTVQSPDVTKALLDVAARHRLWTVADECYDQLTFDGEFTSAGAVADAEHAERLVSLFSFSKVHAMTGWRVGYAALPRQLAAVVAAAQEPLVSCVNTPAQHAALAALTGPQDHVAALRETFRRRHDFVCAALERAGIRHRRASATFYVWMQLNDPAADSVAWALDLLRDHGVAVAPGSAFGPSGEGCVRLSLGVDDDQLAEGVRRIVAKLSS